ncbi:MAG: HDOD domain-containing protein [Solirubrobacteraceae bacterium]|nr:HDOD domain-containing protein [Solirubrobacteraceae bacterium]
MTTVIPNRPQVDAPTTPVPRQRGPGRRLSAAIEAMDTFPALAEAKQRVIAGAAGGGDPAELVAAVEKDVALTIAVLRAANELGQLTGDKVDSIVDAVTTLSAQTIADLAHRMRTFDFLDRGSVWERAPERFRLHAVATQRAIEMIARQTQHDDRDRLLVVALLHDVGQLVLMRAYPGYPDTVHGDEGTPEDRLAREREDLGVDHAMVGGVVTGRWGLPASITAAVAGHHAPNATGDAAHLRLADMLARYSQGCEVSARDMTDCGQAIGLDLDAIRSLMHDVSNAPNEARRQIEPCPLSGREREVLVELASGKVYKQIAEALGLSRSTIRSHLHNVYAKLDTPDRAQAVLKATACGWL